MSRFSLAIPKNRTCDEKSHFFFPLLYFFLWQQKEIELNISMVEVVAWSFGGVRTHPFA